MDVRTRRAKDEGVSPQALEQGNQSSPVTPSLAMKYLLDTDTCSFIMRQSSAVLMERFAGIADIEVAMSVITQGELNSGLARKPSATQPRPASTD